MSLLREHRDSRPGTYYLRTRNTFGYQDVLYNGLSCVGNCDVTLGTPVTVVDGQPTAGIVLALPLPTSTQPLVTISSAEATPPRRRPRTPARSR